MSAPDTNIETQEKRHKPSLFGIGTALVFAGLILVGFIIFTVARGNDPEGAAVQIDSRTGEAVVTDPVTSTDAVNGTAAPAASD